MKKKLSLTRRRALGLHRRLVEIREERGLTLREVATLIHLDSSTLGRIESGEVGVSAERVKEFAGLYGVSVSWLYGETEAKAS